MHRLLDLRQRAREAEQDYSQVLAEIGAYQARCRTLGEKLREGATLGGIEAAKQVLGGEIQNVTRAELEARLGRLRARVALAHIVEVLDSCLARPPAVKWGEDGIRYAHLCVMLVNVCARELADEPGSRSSALCLWGVDGGDAGAKLGCQAVEPQKAPPITDVQPEGEVHTLAVDDALCRQTGKTLCQLREEACRELSRLVGEHPVDWFANPNFLQGRPQVSLLLRLLAEVSAAGAESLLSLLSETLLPFRRSFLLRAFGAGRDGGRRKGAVDLGETLAEVNLYTGLIAQGVAVLGPAPESRMDESVRRYLSRDPEAGAEACPFVPHGTVVLQGTPLSGCPLYKACSLLGLYGRGHQEEAPARTKLDDLVAEKEVEASKAVCRTFSALLSGLGELLVAIQLAGFRATWSASPIALPLSLPDSAIGCGPLSIVHLLRSNPAVLEQAVADLGPDDLLDAASGASLSEKQDNLRIRWRLSLLRACKGLQPILAVREHFMGLERAYSLQFGRGAFFMDLGAEERECFSWWVDEALVRPEGAVRGTRSPDDQGGVVAERNRRLLPSDESPEVPARVVPRCDAVERAAVAQLLSVFGTSDVCVDPRGSQGLLGRQEHLGLLELLADTLRFIGPEWLQARTPSRGSVPSFSLLGGAADAPGTPKGVDAAGTVVEGVISSPLRRLPAAGSEAVSELTSLAPSLVPSAAPSAAPSALSTPVPRGALMPSPAQDLRRNACVVSQTLSQDASWPAIDELDECLCEACEGLLELLCRLSLSLGKDALLLSRASDVAEACLGVMCRFFEKRLQTECSSAVWDYEVTGNPRLRQTVSPKLAQVYPSRVVSLYARLERLAAVQQNSSRFFPVLKGFSDSLYKSRRSLVRDSARAVLILTAPEIRGLAMRCLDLSEHLDTLFAPRAADAVGRLLEELEVHAVSGQKLHSREGVANSYVDTVYREYVSQVAVFSRERVIPDMKLEISRRNGGDPSSVQGNSAGASLSPESAKDGVFCEESHQSAGGMVQGDQQRDEHGMAARSAANLDLLRRYARAMNALQREVAVSLGLEPVDFEGELRSQAGGEASGRVSQRK